MKKLYLILIFISSPISANVWTYTKQVDPFNDQVMHIARVQGNIDKSSVSIRCNSDKKLDIILSTGRYIGNDNRYRTVLRVDKNEPTSGVWSVSTDGTSVFAPKDSIALLSVAFMKGDILVSQTTDYKGSKTVARFSLAKANKSIKSVLEACPLDRIGSAEKGINHDILSHLNRYGPESIICHKKMLSHLGYDVVSRDANKNREYYLAIQKFVDDRSNYYFIHRLYSEASESNNDFKAICGNLRMAD